MKGWLLWGILAVLGLAAGNTTAQTLYVIDSSTTVVLQQSSTPPAGACSAPDPLTEPPWAYTVAPPCAGSPPVPRATTTPFGDVAVDRLTDTVFVTDGVVIAEYAGDPPCPTGPGTPLNSYAVPPITSSKGTTLMGPLTGLGMDSAAGILWVTDGFDIAGLGGVPGVPGTCTAPTVSVPAFAHGLKGFPFLTDLTWDPVSGSLWGCDTAGSVFNIAVGGGAGPMGSFAASPACGLGPVLTGIAYDLATPGATSTFPALYVSDGTTVAYFDASTGTVPASGPFYTPVTCGSSLLPGSSGLAYAAGGFTYGTPRIAMTVGSFGQSSSPNPGFGFEVTGSPPGTVLWLAANFIPGGGPLCRPGSSATTSIWVDPLPPGIVMALYSTPATCTPIPAPLPAGIVPVGVTVVVQIVAVDPLDVFGTALDAAQGLAFTITAP